MLDKNGIAKRIAREVQDGYYVNLGIGIPTLVANFVREDIEARKAERVEEGTDEEGYEENTPSGWSPI